MTALRSYKDPTQNANYVASQHRLREVYCTRLHGYTVLYSKDPTQNANYLASQHRLKEVCCCRLQGYTVQCSTVHTGGESLLSSALTCTVLYWAMSMFLLQSHGVAPCRCSGMLDFLCTQAQEFQHSSLRHSTVEAQYDVAVQLRSCFVSGVVYGRHGTSSSLTPCVLP